MRVQKNPITTNTSTRLLHEIHAQAFARSWDEKAFQDMLTVPGTFALTLGDAGFILCRAVHEQCEILTLAVIPSYQRQGVGEQLVEEAKTYARKNGAQQIFLEVAEENGAALKLYEKTGFSPLHRRKDYYKNVDGSYSDAVMMQCALNPQ